MLQSYIYIYIINSNILCKISVLQKKKITQKKEIPVSGKYPISVCACGSPSLYRDYVISPPINTLAIVM